MAVTLVGSPTAGTHLAGTGTSVATTRNGIVAGSTVVVCVTGGDAFAISNVSDGTITNSAPDVSFHWAGGSQNLAIFSFPSHAGGNFTFTANYAGTGVPFRGLDIVELTPSTFEGSSSASGTSAAPSSGNISPTPTVDGEYIVGFCLGATALTSAGGFADLVNDPTTDVSDVEGLAQSAKAAIAATWTMTSGIWGAVAASYKAVSALVGFGGSRGAPGQGPRDRRGFIKRSIWDYTLMALAAGTIFNADVSESVSVADSQTGQADFASALSEAGTATDTQTASALFVVAIAETGSVADTETGSALFVVDRTEAGVAADSQTGNAIFASALAESLSADDTETGVAVFNTTRLETLAVADSEDGNIGAAIFNVAITESLSASDSETGTAVFVVARAESLTAAESVAAQTTTGAAVSEALSAQDSSTGTLPSGITLAVAQNAGTDPITSGTSANTGVLQNTGVASIAGSNSRTIPIISANNATTPITPAE